MFPNRSWRTSSATRCGKFSPGQASRSYEALLSRLNRSEFTFFVELGNDASLIDPLVDLVQQTVGSGAVCDSSGQLRIGVPPRGLAQRAAARQSGDQPGADGRRSRTAHEPARSLDPDRQAVDEALLARRIFVNVRISTEEARIVIRDEGPGFDVSSVPTSWEPGGLEKKGSRSLSLMRAFMDEVVYNEAGNEVTLVKRKEEEKTVEAPRGIDV